MKRQLLRNLEGVSLKYMKRCTSQKDRSWTNSWNSSIRKSWHTRASGAPYYGYFSKEKICLGERNHTRRRKIWSARRLHKNQQKIKAIFQLCSFDVWPCRSRTHQLCGSCTEEIMGWSNEGLIPVDNEELCLVYCSQTIKQERGIFEMDLQDKNMLLMGVLKSTKQDLWLDDSLRKRGSIMKRNLLQYQGTLPS